VPVRKLSEGLLVGRGRRQSRTVTFPMDYDNIEQPAHYKDSTSFVKLKDFKDNFSDDDADDEEEDEDSQDDDDDDEDGNDDDDDEEEEEDDDE